MKLYLKDTNPFRLEIPHMESVGWFQGKSLFNPSSYDDTNITFHWVSSGNPVHMQKLPSQQPGQVEWKNQNL